MDSLSQDGFASHDAHQLAFGADEVDIGGKQPEIGTHLHDLVFKAGGLSQDRIGAGLDALGFKAQMYGQMGLGIEVDGNDL